MAGGTRFAVMLGSDEGLGAAGTIAGPLARAAAGWRGRGVTDQPRHGRHAGSPGTARAPAGSRRRRWPWVLAVVVVVLLVAAGVVAGVTLAGQARDARAELEQAAGLVSTLEQQASSGDAAATTRTLAQLQQHATTAADLTHGRLWDLAARLPLQGQNVAAAQTVSTVVDDLAQHALPPLVTTVGALSGNLLDDGRVDLEPLQAAGPQLAQAQQSVAGAQQQLDGIDTASLDPALAGPVAELAQKLQALQGTLTAAQKATALLPAMLGADGSRTYLLLVQNNAEVRATGGLPGFVAELHADDGALSLSDQRAGGTVGPFQPPILPMTKDERVVFGPQMTQYFGDVNFTPDFPRTAQIATAMWRAQTGHEVDGVLSVDPIALAAVLRATGPVKLPGGETLNSDNAVSKLLNDVYLRIIDPVKQDAYFAAAANAIFHALSTGQGDTLAAVKALAADRSRVFVWSRNPDEQQQLQDAGLTGALDPDGLGVYLNDGSGAKMSYYLDTGVDVARTCSAGAQQLTATVTLHSIAPAGVAKLPPYVTGGGNYVPVGHTYTTVLVFAPAGARITGVTDSTGRDGFVVSRFGDQAVVQGTTDITPGGSATVTVELELDGTAEPPVRVTPGVRPSEPTIQAAPTCG